MRQINQKKTGAIIGYAYTLLQAVISIAYIPVLLNGIGKNEYGLYQIVGSVIAYFSAMEAPLCAAVLKFYTEYKVQNNTVKMENTLAIGRRIFFLLACAMIVVSVPTVYLMRLSFVSSFTAFELYEATVMFCIMLANLIISMLNYVYLAVINAHERYVFLKTASLVTLILQPLMVIAVIQKLPYAYVIVLIHVILNLALSAVRYFYAKKRLNCKIKFHYLDKILLKGMLKLTAATFFVAIADQVFWKTDQLIIGAMYGTGEASVYSVGAQINTMYISIACVLGGMLLPSVTSILAEKDERKVSAFFAKIGRLQSYFVALILFGVIAFGKEFIYIIAGEGFQEAYYVAVLIMLPYAIDLIQICGGSILQARNQYGYRAKVLGIAAVLNIVLTIILVKIMGIVGAALSTSITIFISNGLIMNIIYRRKCGLDIRMFWKRVLKIWLMGILMLPVSRVIKLVEFNNEIVQFGVHVAMFMVVYCLIMYLFVMSDEEKHLLGRVSLRRK